MSEAVNLKQIYEHLLLDHANDNVDFSVIKHCVDAMVDVAGSANFDGVEYGALAITMAFYTGLAMSLRNANKLDESDLNDFISRLESCSKDELMFVTDAFAASIHCITFDDLYHAIDYTLLILNESFKRDDAPEMMQISICGMTTVLLNDFLHQLDLTDEDLTHISTYEA